jgi:HPt (histidine-containing phosphotransfer) domain-containing protein
VTTSVATGRARPQPATLGSDPVDLDHLARQTGGNVALEREVLALFLERSAADLAQLKAAATGTGRRDIAHRMVGSARAIGAGEVARLAAAVMDAAPAGAAELGELEAAVRAAQRFVSERLAG